MTNGTFTRQHMLCAKLKYNFRALFIINREFREMLMHLVTFFLYMFTKWFCLWQEVQWYCYGRTCSVSAVVVNGVCPGEREDTWCTVLRTIDNSKLYSFLQYCWVLSVYCRVFFNKRSLFKTLVVMAETNTENNQVRVYIFSM